MVINFIEMILWGSRITFSTTDKTVMTSEGCTLIRLFKNSSEKVMEKYSFPVRRVFLGLSISKTATKVPVFVANKMSTELSVCKGEIFMICIDRPLDIPCMFISCLPVIGMWVKFSFKVKSFFFLSIKYSAASAITTDVIDRIRLRVLCCILAPVLK